ncbi:MAG: hypothetical protein KME04_15370 [Pleurocapsa minor GSE-CHR-MK-17-07R]|jgi:hypothetical protein|nr:hypothetical protein [Pleurocapsa minor GSE-CHR-MK 17-07R]
MSVTKSRGGVPNLIVAERVLKRMLQATRQHMQDETGEAMVGLVVPPSQGASVASVYILDTIAPDASAVRQQFTFQQGDARQDELIYWLQENWDVGRREQRPTGVRRIFGAGAGGKFDVPLRFLGDWHKQPGHMIQPSGGDLDTALDWILDPENETDFLIAPIVTLGHAATVEANSPISNFVTVPTGSGDALRADFWYIDRKTQLFQPVTPAVYPDDQLPILSPYPWHIQQEARYEEELAAFTKDGLFQAMSYWNADSELPLELCFLTGRVGADHLLLLVTPNDYPEHAPQVRISPYIPMASGDDIYAVFRQAFEHSKVLPLDLKWHPKMLLVDAVRAAEESLVPASAKPSPAKQPAPEHKPASADLTDKKTEHGS